MAKLIEKLQRDVNNLETKLRREYLNQLLNLCTKQQIDLFNRMYPNNPTNNQIENAIMQIGRTLSQENSAIEKLCSEKKDLQVENCTLKIQIKSLENRIKELALEEIEVKIVGDNDLLNALQRAGVEKTEIWEYAMEILEENI